MTNQLRDKFDHFRDFEFKERMFTSLVDLITQAIFLAITPQVRKTSFFQNVFASCLFDIFFQIILFQPLTLRYFPQVREAFSSLSRGDRKDITAYKTFLVSVSAITRDTIWWLHDVVPKTFKPDPNVYTKMLYKSLFMTNTHEEYYR